MQTTPLQELHDAIEAAGIPIHGIGSNGVVSFRSEATPQQRAQAATIVQGFDLRPRKPRAFAAVLADVKSLSAADRQTLIDRALAAAVIENPRLARGLAKPFDGDKT